MLLDEPAAGLDTAESRRSSATGCARSSTPGITIFLIDHDMGLVLGVCDYIYVIEFGEHDRRGHAGRDPRRPDASSTPTSASPSRRGRGRHGRLEPRRSDHDDRCSRSTSLSAGYNGVPVVRDLNLHVDAGEVVALLGPNGAGKTTTLLTVSGAATRSSGRLKVFGEPVAGGRPHRSPGDGLAHVPEDRSLFFELTVRENLRLGYGRRAAADIDQALEYFPALEPLIRTAGRAAVGRRAADAGDGAGAHRRSRRC